MVADGREKVFAELTGLVLDEQEFTAAVAAENVPGMKNLGTELSARRELLDQVRTVEEAYRNATDRLRSMPGVAEDPTTAAAPWSATASVGRKAAHSTYPLSARYGVMVCWSTSDPPRQYLAPWPM